MTRGKRSLPQSRSVWVALLLSGVCGRAEAVVSDAKLWSTNVASPISWPLSAAVVPAGKVRPALLAGALEARLVDGGKNNLALKLAITITRPSDENHRAFWNATLAYPQYSWMSAVRVWDENHQWLWPNLTYLLRVFGTRPMDRYGGWDPGKKVDDDFAAVLIRKYDATGNHESNATADHPFVSAEWYAVGNTNVDATTIVHAARSEEFTVHLGDKHATQAGQIRLWLIYADFLGAPIPRGWPKAPEYHGGILKFFKISWTHQPAHMCACSVAEESPPESTHFDWKRWLNRPTESAEVEAAARLED